ncbi:Predicted transcriptional regulator, contains HTH domain [Natronorubrum sediminis]|uniref:Predicted transcriptional regulator, contains HTH domain n=1 Tax=Natronorubrum sediminis TaxID=640943 RepID=A0A1H6FRB2_9EURY|nr:ArsR family transcriptional regulator [Natronorubrum sediminis]SEH12403.1 Predicted transcriptional regulator, contains HTH domain [Natronorubrum sediminis]
MESALEEIEFLALSPNRVAVLDSLATSERTRNELAAETGASQATLGRILNDFRDRAWIEREGSTYVATATGRLVSSGFTDLREIIETEQRLRGVVEYLPTDSLTFDLRRLADANITTPSQMRPNAPLSRLLELLEDADEVWTVSHAFNEQTLTVVQERTASGEQAFKGVFSRRAIDALATDDELQTRLEELLEEDDAAVRVREDGVPLAVMLLDDVVYLLVRDEHGVLRASIDTDDEVVRSWARETVDDYWERADSLEVSSDEFLE